MGEVPRFGKVRRSERISNRRDYCSVWRTRRTPNHINNCNCMDNSNDDDLFSDDNSITSMAQSPRVKRKRARTKTPYIPTGRPRGRPRKYLKMGLSNLVDQPNELPRVPIMKVKKIWSQIYDINKLEETVMKKEEPDKGSPVEADKPEIADMELVLEIKTENKSNIEEGGQSSAEETGTNYTP